MTKSFGDHLEDQWLTLDKEKCKKWKDMGHGTFCQVSNKVRFKIIEFDEEKFVPVKSGWITGEVKSILNGVVVLVNVSQEGGEFRKEYELPEHNMDELQIWRVLATKEQIDCFSAQQPAPQS
jgi:hypothetical protein